MKGKAITGPGPDRGPVFQEFALFPWKTVLGNVMYGPRQQGVKSAEAEALLSTYYGASMVEQKLIWSAMAAGTPRRQILFKVVLPAAVPSILTGCRIGLVISCIVVFLAEMITSTEGLGHLLVTAARTFQAVDMFVPLITISLLGLILNGLLQGLRAWLLRGFPEV